MTRYTLPIPNTSAGSSPIVRSIPMMKSGTVIGVIFNLIAAATAPGAGDKIGMIVQVKVNASGMNEEAGTEAGDQVVAQAAVFSGTTATDQFGSPTNCLIPANFPVSLGMVLCVTASNVLDDISATAILGGQVIVIVKD